MKKGIKLCLILCMVLLLTGCGSEEKETEKPTKTPESEIKVEDNSKMDTLVCNIGDDEVTFILQYGKIFSYSDKKWGEHTETEIAEENKKLEFIYTNEDAISWISSEAKSAGYTCIVK